ncbi:MAG: HD domain-containing protein [Alkalispirochaeta sp.]
MNIPELATHSIDYRVVGVSALELFMDVTPSPIVSIETTADVVELASVVERLSFPGFPGWDAMFTAGGNRVLVRSVDQFGAAPHRHGESAWSDQGLRHPLMRLTYDPRRRAFADPDGLYETLAVARSRLGARHARKKLDATDIEPVEVDNLDAVEAAVLSARTPLVPRGYPLTVPTWTPIPGIPGTWHRLLLEQILTGRFAWRGLEILSRSGYVDDVLPELAPMNRTDHSKEGHPEGNVWKHSVETMKYRKTPEFIVSLALLLHDAGKPYAEAEGQNRFNRHAEIGADLSRRLLERLDAHRGDVEDVTWIIRNHMMPGALERLPDYRRDPIMESPLFPQLLEVYRCDLSSTYRGPDGYYRACRVYRRFLKRDRRRREECATRRLVELYVE